MTGHKHAALMLQYAQDAAETAEPWRLWQNRNPTFNRPDLWYALVDHPEWNPALEYRRKPRTIRIGEFDVPEPIREELKRFTEYWLPSIHVADEPQCFRWDSDAADARNLRNGLVFRTREDAITCARALLSLLEPRK